MSDCAVTNFTESTRTVLNYIENKLQTMGNWNEVRTMEGATEEELFTEFPEIQSPACVLFYRGSDYGTKPRRKFKFSIWVIHQNHTDKKHARELAFTDVDFIINIFDREIINDHTLVRVKSDRRVNAKSPGLVLYEIEFTAEDY